MGLKNFRLIQTGLNVQPLVDAINSRAHLWDELTGRQNYEGSAHKYTRSIFLRWCNKQDLVAAFTDLEAIDYPALHDLAPEVKGLIDPLLNTIHCLEIGRVIITELKAGGEIYPHIDEGPVADYYDRFHVVLASDEGNEFNCGEDQVWMKPGEFWWFNNKQTHWLKNNTKNPRWHVVIDAVSGLYQREIT